MSELKTVRVNVQLRGDSATIAGATVQMLLNHYEIDGGFVVPRQIEGTTDDQGRASFDVWPNSRGGRDSVYNIKIVNGRTPIVEGTATFPESAGPLDLFAYLQGPKYAARPRAHDALVHAAEHAAAEATSEARTQVLDAIDLARADALQAVGTDREAALNALQSALDDTIKALEKSQSGLQEEVVALRDEVVSKRDAVATDRVAVANQRRLAEEAANAAAGDAEQTAADRTATTEARDRAVTAADQTAGLTSWESDGRVLTTPLLIAPPSILRDDLPLDVPSGSRAWVPDCPKPPGSLIARPGAECVFAGQWLRASDYGDIYTPLDRIYIGRDGMYTHIRESVLYQDAELATPIGPAPQTAGSIRDESPIGLHLTQNSVNKRAGWDGTRLEMDGVDDAYITSRAVSAGYNVPLYVAVALKHISGANNYEILQFEGDGLIAQVGTRFARARVYYRFEDDTAVGRAVGVAEPGTRTPTGSDFIAFELSTNAIYIVSYDGVRYEIGYDDYVLPAEWTSTGKVRIFGGAPNADLIGAAVHVGGTTQDERARINKYINGDTSD